MRLFSLLIFFFGCFAVSSSSAQISDSNIAKCAKAEGISKAECAKRCSGWASKASLLSIAVLDTEAKPQKACSYGQAAMAEAKLVSSETIEAGTSKSLKKTCKYSQAKCASKSKSSLVVEESKVKTEKKLTRA